MSIPTPATRPSDLKVTDMARLSAPASDTPKTERKSIRFRKMFTHRPGSSSSSSPAKLAKAHQSVDSSPLSSPSVKPGFQQIGLLPSERPSLGSQGNTDMDDLDADNEGGLAFTKEHVDEPVTTAVQDKKIEGRFKIAEQNPSGNSSAIIEFVPKTIKDTQQCSSLPFGSSYRIADAMHAKNSSSHPKPSSVGGKRPRSRSFVAAELNHPRRDTRSLSPQQSKNTDMLDMNDLLERCRMSLQAAHDNFNNLKLINPVADYDNDSISCESCLSNVVENESSIHSGTREYISQQIAEALLEYEGKDHGPDGQRSMATRVTFNINLGGLSATKTKQVDSGQSENALCAVNSSIGPFIITHSRIARDVQLSIISFYLLLVLGSALLGPKTLAIAVWRSVVLLGVYAIAICRLGWAERLERDVLLAPVFYAFSVAQGVGRQIIEQIRVEIAASVAGGINRNGRGEEIRVSSQ